MQEFTKWTRFANILLVPMLIVLPLWVAIGRAVVGVGGWILFITILFVGPILLVAQIVLLALLPRYTAPDGKKHLSPRSARLFLVYSLLVLLFGAFLVDGGDTPESINSLFSAIFGQQLTGMSATIAVGAFIGSIVLFIMLVVTGITERKHLKTQHDTQNVATTAPPTIVEPIPSSEPSPIQPVIQGSNGKSQNPWD